MLSDNYDVASARLKSTLKRLRRDTDLAVEYARIMKEREERGIIEEVDSHDVSTVGKTYYMPHQVVIRDDKETSRARIVYDASAKKIGASLNECPLKGETDLADLLGVVLRFS